MVPRSHASTPKALQHSKASRNLTDLFLQVLETELRRPKRIRQLRRRVSSVPSAFDKLVPFAPLHWIDGLLEVHIEEHIRGHVPYAEDQPYPYAILTTHVLFRGFQAGSMAGTLAGTLQHTYLRLFKAPRSPSAIAPSAEKAMGPASASAESSAATISAMRANTTLARQRPGLATTLLRSTGVGAVLGTGCMAVMLGARMYGREEIEWADRSWRLLENRGQVEVDGWSVVGAVAGAVGVLLGERRARAARLGTGNGTGVGRALVIRGVGGAGIGASAGVVGYLVWRYGVRGGRREEL